MTDRYDLVIIGMGSGGMPAAELAASLPIRVAVVERDRVGGDCLWTGCVPSKALLASAKAAQVMRTADRWGLPSVDPEVDTEAVWKRVRAVQQEIATTDDEPKRYERLGLEIIKGEALIVDPHTVAVSPSGSGSGQHSPSGSGSGGHSRTLRTRFILVCTGSRPTEPDLPGLREAGYLTSETVWDLEQVPASITMIGGGPIAVELAQAFTRLGIRTTVLQKGPGILPRDEPSLVAILSGLLRDEGVDIRFHVDTERIEVSPEGKTVVGRAAGHAASWTADELFVAIGRTPNVEGLGLQEVGVEVTGRGITVDERMQTSVPSIYAAGDIAGRFLFTHSSAHEGVRAVRDMFFPGKGTVSNLVPWCTFTDPELAHVGLTVAEAREKHGDDVHVHRIDLIHSDRARADGHSEGAVIAVTAKGTLVGGHILAPAAGELIHELALAVHKEMKLTELASLIHVYPTLSISIGQLAAEAAFEGAARFAWTVRLKKLAWRLRGR